MSFNIYVGLNDYYSNKMYSIGVVHRTQLRGCRQWRVDDAPALPLTHTRARSEDLDNHKTERSTLCLTFYSIYSFIVSLLYILLPLTTWRCV